LLLLETFTSVEVNTRKAVSNNFRDTWGDEMHRTEAASAVKKAD
jgi:hypothetical protein